MPTNVEEVIDFLKIQVGDKVIEATVKEKEEAKEKYGDAVARG